MFTSSVTSAESYSGVVANNQHLSKQDAIVEQLGIHGPSVAADIIALISTDGRDHTRFRELWIQGRVRKTGKTEVAKTTNKKGDVWELVPKGLEAEAKLEYWKDKAIRLQTELAQLDSLIGEADQQIQILQETKHEN